MAYENIRRYPKPHTSGDGKGGTAIYIGGNNLDTNNLYVTNLNAVNVDTDKLKANNIDCTIGNFKYIMSQYGEISKIEGNELKYTNGRIDFFDASEIATNKLIVNDEATIKNLIADYIKSTKTI